MTSPGFERDPDLPVTAADRGTRLHELVHQTDEPVDLDEKDAEQLAFCRSVLRQVREQLGDRRIELTETYVSVDDVQIHDPSTDTWWRGTSGGFLDWCGIVGDRAFILDFKFGVMALPPAASNPQGWVYVLGVFHQFPEVQQVTMGFVLAAKKHFDTAEFTRADIPRLMEQIRAIIAAAKVARAGEVSCSPGINTCPFCRHRAQCRHLWDVVRRLGQQFAGVELPGSADPSRLDDPALAGQVLRLGQLIQSWFEAFRRKVTQKVIDSEDDWAPEGFVLRERRNWSVDSGALERAASSLGIPDDVLARAREYRLPVLLEWAGSQAPRGQKLTARQTLLDTLVTSGVVNCTDPIFYLERLDDHASVKDDAR